MWLMTKRGFYSVVMHRDDPYAVVIRARDREDIERLCELPEMERYKGRIIATPKADYPYRVYATAAEWQATVGWLAKEIDYDNFKDAVKVEQGPERADTYMRVWGDLHGIEYEGREPEEFGAPLRFWPDEVTSSPPDPLGCSTCGSQRRDRMVRWLEVDGIRIDYCADDAACGEARAREALDNEI